MIPQSGRDQQVSLNDARPPPPQRIAPAEEGNGLGKPLYLQKHRIRSTEQTITVTAPRRPAHAGIDPHHLLIDWEIDDNVDEVKIESGGRIKRNMRVSP